MDKMEIENIMEEKAQTVFARNFTIFLERLDDQFKLVQEGFQGVHEKMDRNFSEIREDLEQIKRNTDTNSLEILALQDKDRESWRKTEILEEEYKLLGKRVERLEGKYNYV